MEDSGMNTAEAAGMAAFREQRAWKFEARPMSPPVLNPYEVRPGQPRKGRELEAWAWHLGWRLAEYSIKGGR